MIYCERRPAAGAPVQKLDLLWDGADRLRQVKDRDTGSTLFTATYDGDGRRVSKWDAWTGQHDYTWGPDGLLHDSNNGNPIVYTPGLAQRSATSDLFFHTDWLGSTRWMSEAGNGNSFPYYRLYDSQGQKLVATGALALVKRIRLVATGALALVKRIRLVSSGALDQVHDMFDEGGRFVGTF
jgi:hypothetical protein